MFDEQRQRAIENSGRVAVRDRVPSQFLRASQLGMGLGADGDLQQVAIGRERSDGWTRAIFDRTHNRSLSQTRNMLVGGKTSPATPLGSGRSATTSSTEHFATVGAD